MNNYRKIEILRARNKTLVEKYEKAKADLEACEIENAETKEKYDKLISELEFIKEEWEKSFNELEKLKIDFKQLMHKVRKLKSTILKTQLPWYKRITNKKLNR